MENIENLENRIERLEGGFAAMEVDFAAIKRHLESHTDLLKQIAHILARHTQLLGSMGEADRHLADSMNILTNLTKMGVER